jgi:hypothetical protein
LSASSCFASPSAKFEKTECDIGEVQAGQSAKASIAFSNTGDEPLRIIRINKSCGCTQASAAKTELAPGEPSTVEITFTAATVGGGGKIGKTVTVVTNDPTDPTIRLQVTGTVIPVATLSPENINFGTIQRGSTIEKTIILTPTKSKGFSVDKIVAPATSRTAATFEKRKDGSYRINVKIKAGAKAGRLGERLTVMTGSPSKATLAFFVYGNVEDQPQSNAKP